MPGRYPERDKDSRAHRHREFAEQQSDVTAHQEQRNEHRDKRERDRHGREADLARSRPERKEHGWLYRVLERGFDALLNVYEAGLRVVLRHRFTLMVMLGTIALTGYLYMIIPKGFFPQQDTGLIIGQSEAARSITTPVIYIYFDRLQAWITRRKTNKSVTSGKTQPQPAE
jgi:multidrug efflux pump subunit AcrB